MFLPERTVIFKPDWEGASAPLVPAGYPYFLQDLAVSETWVAGRCSGFAQPSASYPTELAFP